MFKLFVQSYICGCSQRLRSAYKCVAKNIYKYFAVKSHNWVILTLYEIKINYSIYTVICINVSVCRYLKYLYM